MWHGNGGFGYDISLITKTNAVLVFFPQRQVMLGKAFIRLLKMLFLLE